MRKASRSALAATCLLAAAAQVPAADRHWARLGGTGVAAGFAGPAGRAVDGTWFSGDGRRLYATLADSTVWATGDLGLSWDPVDAEALQPHGPLEPEALGGGMRVFRNPFRAGVAYALGEHLFRSDDGGRTWTNLTAIGSDSVIGRWQSAVAFSPLEPDLVVVGNSMGLWKSYDQGVTWSSLNDGLPNFPGARFARTAGGSPTTLVAPSLGTLDLIRTPAGPTWRAKPDALAAADGFPPAGLDGPRARAAALQPDLTVSDRVWRDGHSISESLTGCAGAAGCEQHAVSAFAAAGDRLWAGTSNGRIWTSADSGANWELSWSDPYGGPVASLWSDPDLPSTALAIAGGRVLRSTNAGRSWFDISSDLPASDWRAVAGHLSTGSVFVAGPLGVRHAMTDLRVPGPAGAWTALDGDLPDDGVDDLSIDALRGRLYALVGGHGVYWTRTPQVERALRILSAADLSVRPAAPGSLLTITGANALRARAAGQPAPILDAQPGRTQLQVPFTVDGQSLRLQLDAAGSSHTLEMPLERVAPAIFVVSGEALVLDAGTGALVGWGQPARAGGTVLVMATGLGEVAPPWPAGLPSPALDPPRVVARIEATVGGVPAQVATAHLAPNFVGIYVVEVQLPTTARPGALELAISADGRPSNSVKLVVGR